MVDTCSTTFASFPTSWTPTYMRTNGCWDKEYVCAYRWVLRGLPPLYAATKVIKEHRIGIEINRWKKQKRSTR